MSNDELRHTIQSAANKSKAFNGFINWFFFCRESIISENDREKQKKIKKYTDKHPGMNHVIKLRKHTTKNSGRNMPTYRCKSGRSIF